MSDPLLIPDARGSISKCPLRRQRHIHGTTATATSMVRDEWRQCDARPGWDEEVSRAPFVRTVQSVAMCGRKSVSLNATMTATTSFALLSGPVESHPQPLVTQSASRSHGHHHPRRHASGDRSSEAHGCRRSIRSDVRRPRRVSWLKQAVQIPGVNRRTNEAVLGLP
jgi:hypothetical protein